MEDNSCAKCGHTPLYERRRSNRRWRKNVNHDKEKRNSDRRQEENRVGGCYRSPDGDICPECYSQS